jgi:hypothetical protein
MNAQLTVLPRRGRADEAAGATVAWPAVLAGVVVAVAIAVVLFALGSGVELGAAARPGPPAGAILPPGIWLCLMQFLSAAGGGYLAGRLRRRSPETVAEEISFRDTAHGLLVWAVVVVISAALVLSVNASLFGAVARGPVSTSMPFTEGGRSGGDVTAAGAAASEPFPTLLAQAGRDRSGLTAGLADRAELARGVVDAYDGLSSAERALLRGQLAARLDISEAQSGQQIAAAIGRARWTAAPGAGRRVMDADFTARQTIDLGASPPQDMARGAASRLSWWLFVSLLLGGLGASAAAILGGRRRDRVGGMA